MQVQITGKDIDLGVALQTHVTERLDAGIRKYFGRSVEAQVTFSREGSYIRCESTAHLASGVFLATQGEGGDAYAAFEDALEHLEKRVRRHKRRLKNHHANHKSNLPAEDARSYVIRPLEPDLEGEPEDSAVEDAPIIVAENVTKLRVMTVSDAVLQLDLVDEPLLVFKNAAHGEVNVVYKRADGNVGWIDPT